VRRVWPICVHLDHITSFRPSVSISTRSILSTNDCRPVIGNSICSICPLLMYPFLGENQKDHRLVKAARKPSLGQLSKYSVWGIIPSNNSPGIREINSRTWKSSFKQRQVHVTVSHGTEADISCWSAKSPLNGNSNHQGVNQSYNWNIEPCTKCRKHITEMIVLCEGE
jgi:hypothetical protein